jgi:hypothetical protein
MWGDIFSLVKEMSFFDKKNGLGYSLGHLFAISSGRPALGANSQNNKGRTHS